MKYAIAVFAFLLITLGVVFIVQGSFPPTTLNDESEHVSASIFPLYDITKNIAGDAIEVSLVLPPGASPHTFDPTPSTIRSLQNSRVVYAVGHGFDDWSEELASSTRADHVVVDQGISIRTREEGDEHEEEEDDHGPEDPHYWLTIPNAEKIALTIKNDLSYRFPEYTDAFESNYASYLVQLAATDEFIRTQLNDVSNTHLITLHDAWYYFADEYQLEIAGTFEPTAGREPTPQYLTELSSAITSNDVRVIYSEPQLSISSLSAFADDLNIEIIELDPVGGISERDSYIDLMTYNAIIIAQHQ